MTSTEKLVERLRALGEDDFYYSPAMTHRLINKAADALEAKDARIAELEAALEPFAAIRLRTNDESRATRIFVMTGPKSMEPDGAKGPPVTAFRRAASARGRE